MPIVTIPNQPINLDPPQRDECNIGDGREYCTMYNGSDYAYLQFKQTPCGANKVANGNFSATPPDQGWTLDAGWTAIANSIGGSLTDGTVVHTPGTIDYLIQLIPFTTGKYYKITITVGNRTAGGVEIILGGTSLGSITSNGEFTLYGYAAGGNNLQIKANSAFDGYVAYISCYELRNDYSAVLVDADTLGSVSQPSFTYTYQEDFVTVSWQWSGIAYGCYKVLIGDPCNPGSSTEILTNPSFDTTSNWTIDDVGGGAPMMSIFGGNLVVQTPKNNPGVVDTEVGYQLLPDRTGTCCYRATITFGTIDAALSGFQFIVGIGNSSYSGFDSGYFTPTSNTTYTFDFCGVNFATIANRRFFIGVTGTYPNSPNNLFARIASVSLRAIYNCATGGSSFESNCLTVAADHDCAKLTIGQCASGSVKYGFRWGSFLLAQRSRFLKFNPFYPTEGEDYEYSNGRRALTFAKREKYYEGLFDYADETFHDATSTQILCDTFTIDGVEYFVSPDNYKPEWANNGNQQLAQSKIELRKKTSTIQSN